MKVWVRGYKGTGVFSKFIMWFTRGEYSHNSLVFMDGTTYTEIESIEGKGVIQHPPHSTHNFDELVAPLTWEQAETAYLTAKGLVGGGYDKLGVFGFLIHKKIHNPLNWFCAEFDAFVLWKAGYPLSRREPYRETPASVMESLRLVDPVKQQGAA